MLSETGSHACNVARGEMRDDKSTESPVFFASAPVYRERSPTVNRTVFDAQPLDLSRSQRHERRVGHRVFRIAHAENHRFTLRRQCGSARLASSAQIWVRVLPIRGVEDR
ncbi:MAG: hypothetical protein ACXVJT_10300, partial [Thermoanaerobaculia bacterium]